MKKLRSESAAGLERREFLSVVSPCYNEAETVEVFYMELTKSLEGLKGLEYEIVFVDDGSRDGTLEKLNAIAERDERVRVCSLSRNFGHQIALTAGLDAAEGDAVILMDSDMQHPPSLIGSMVAYWREGYEIVSAIRQKTQGAGFFKNATSRGFYWVLNRLSDTHIPPGAADFCLLSRRVCEALGQMREKHRFLRGLVSWVGYRRAFVPYEAARRAGGQSKYTPRKMLSLAMDAVMSFSSFPLKMATRLGVIITMPGVAYLTWILGRWIFVGDLVPGWASLICVMLILGGCQLCCIGLIGQYLARIFDEVKDRPVYLLKQEPQRRRRPKRRGPSSREQKTVYNVELDLTNAEVEAEIPAVQLGADGDA